MQTKLNPRALEYHPIPPGITGDQPFSFPPPYPTLIHHLPPPPYFFSPTQNFTPHAYTADSTFHYVTNPLAPPVVTINPPPHKRGPPPVVTINSPPRGSPAVIENRSWQRGRGQGTGFRFAADYHIVGRRKFRNKNKNKHEIVPIKRDQHQTTVMIRNVPYDCHREQLITLLDGFCMMENSNKNRTAVYAYDFLYLPIDFGTRRGMGYAFVNFTNARAAWKFFSFYHNTRWDFVEWVKWPKKMDIVSADIQGKEALVNNFSGSHFECETDEYLPVCFSPARDGSGLPVKLTHIGRRTGNFTAGRRA